LLVLSLSWGLSLYGSKTCRGFSRVSWTSPLLGNLLLLLLDCADRALIVACPLLPFQALISDRAAASNVKLRNAQLKRPQKKPQSFVRQQVDQIQDGGAASFTPVVRRKSTLYPRSITSSSFAAPVQLVKTSW